MGLGTGPQPTRPPGSDRETLRRPLAIAVPERLRETVSPNPSSPMRIARHQARSNATRLPTMPTPLGSSRVFRSRGSRMARRLSPRALARGALARGAPARAGRARSPRYRNRRTPLRQDFPELISRWPVSQHRNRGRNRARAALPIRNAECRQRARSIRIRTACPGRSLRRPQWPQQGGERSSPPREMSWFPPDRFLLPAHPPGRVHVR